MKKQQEWLSVYQYSKLIGKSKSQIYLDIRTGKIPKRKVRTAIIKVQRKQILVDKKDLDKSTGQ